MTTCLLSVALYVSIPLLTPRCCRTLISLLLVGSARAQNWGSWKACGFVNAHQNQQWPVLLKWSSWLINQLLITWLFFFSFFPEGAIVTHEKWSGLQRKVGPRFVATRVPRTGAWCLCLSSARASFCDGAAHVQIRDKTDIPLLCQLIRCHSLSFSW